MANEYVFPVEFAWDGVGPRIERFACAKPEHRLVADEDGTLTSTLPDAEFCYLTHAPPQVFARPAVSPPILSEEIRLDVSVVAKGVACSLWIIEFEVDRRLASHSHRLGSSERSIVWKPAPTCTSVRFALRVSGSGRLSLLRIAAKPVGPARPHKAAVQTVAPAASRAPERPVARARPPAAKDARGSVMSVAPGGSSSEIDAATSAFEAKCLSVWRALHRPTMLIPDIVPNVYSPRLDTLIGFGEPPSVLPLPRDGDDADQARRVLASLGIKDDALVLDGAVQSTAVFPHLEQALRRGSYSWTCPFTGIAIQSRDSFLVSEPDGRPYTFVRFEKRSQVFYLILCPFRGARIGAYFPDHELVVSRLKLGRVVCVFRALMLRYAAAVRRYLINRAGRPVAVPLNTMSHLGHVLTNELEAVNWLLDAGLESKVDVWLKGEVGFFDIEALLPAISTSKIRTVPTADARFRFCVENQLLVIRPQIADAYMSPALSRRLMSFVRGEGARSGQAEEIKTRLAPFFPVVWCELRANDRVWINQIAGIAHVAAALKQHYARPAVVIAGWSRMQVRRTEDERMIAHEQEALAAICEATGDMANFVVSGTSIVEKMLWAESCDAHLSIFGTGMMFPILSKLPGVLLVSEHYQTREFLMGDGERQAHFMEGDDLVVLPLRHVKDDHREKNPQKRAFTVNVEALTSMLLSQIPAQPASS